MSDLETLKNLGQLGVTGLLGALILALARGWLRWDWNFKEQRESYEARIVQLEKAGLQAEKERMASEASLKEQLSKADKRGDRWEAIATRAITTAESVAGAAATKPPGAEM